MTDDKVVAQEVQYSAIEVESKNGGFARIAVRSPTDEEAFKQFKKVRKELTR